MLIYSQKFIASIYILRGILEGLSSKIKFNKFIEIKRDNILMGKKGSYKRVDFSYGLKLGVVNKFMITISADIYFRVCNNNLHNCHNIIVSYS